MNIGIRIKQRRKELGMSADKLGEILGKDRSTIYRYEKGDIENLPLDILEPIARALRTTPAYLMGWESGDHPSATPTAKTKAPDEITEGEKLLLDLFRKLPDEAQKMYLEVLRNSLKSPS